jgi:putative ABC transport system permease protein
VPVLASLYPFIVNLRVTAAEAMSIYQMGKGRFGAGLLDQLLSGANLWFARRVLPRPLLLSVRNIFRRKGRLALTLITLTLAGATFIGVFSVSASLGQATDDIMRLWNFDTLITFRQPYRIKKIKREAERVPGVARTDIWIQLPGRRVREDGSESGVIYLFAPRADSELAISPVIVQGRWLLPEDDNALVVNATLLKDESDVEVGDEMVLKIEGRERTFRVVGVSVGGLAPFAYLGYDYLAQITGNVGRADTALVATQAHDEAYVAEATKALEAHFGQVGMRVSNVQTAIAERAQTEANFSLITSLLLVMAILLAIVGGLGLMGTMGINVLERTREIGVLRAIGAPNKGVASVFIREGIAIGILSWALGAALAFPLGKGLSDAVGTLVMGVPLTFSYSIAGVWLWLAVVVVLSALASSLPARSASRLTVREVLAYE